MIRYDVNRTCPVTGQDAVAVVGHIAAGAIGPSNPTYRAGFLDILGVSASDEFPIVEGPTGFVYAGWLPDPTFLKRVYEDAIDHSVTVTETVEYRRGLLELAAAFLGFVNKPAHRPLRLLDYGCGYGALLRILGARDIQVTGYEPSAERSLRADQSNIQLLNDLDEVRDAGPFDLFVCTEVLEHVPDPRQVLRFFRANAAPGAMLAITVPNCSRDYVRRSLDAAARGGDLSAVFNPWEHLNYFSAASLRALLAEEGFEVVNDYGRQWTMREACARFGDEPPRPRALNLLRIAKRAWRAEPSTQLFCRCL